MMKKTTRNKIVIASIIAVCTVLSWSGKNDTHINVYASSSGLNVKSFVQEVHVYSEAELEVRESIVLDNYQGMNFVRRIPRKFSLNDRSYTLGIKNVSVVISSVESPVVKQTNKIDEVVLDIDLQQATRVPIVLNIKYQLERGFYIDDQDEVHFVVNPLGENQGHDIHDSVLSVYSKRYKVGSVNCFAGDLSARQKLCLAQFSDYSAEFLSTSNMTPDMGFIYTFSLRDSSDMEVPSGTKIFLSEVLYYLRIYTFRTVLFVLGIYLFYKLTKSSLYIRKKHSESTDV